MAGQVARFAVGAGLVVAGMVALGAQQGMRPHMPLPDEAGPWDSDVLVYKITPEGRPDLMATFERSGVSTLTRLQSRRLMVAHQYFPEDPGRFDKVAVRFSDDDGQTWSTPRVITLSGLPDGMRSPFDPTLVTLPDGRVRMYFTSVGVVSPGAEAPGLRVPQPSVPAIYSAISTNALDFTVEPGRRFGIDGRPVIDSAVVLHRGIFHLYSPDNGAMPAAAPGVPPNIGDRAPDGVGYHATSTDGLTFTRVDDVRVDGRRRWLGNAYSDGTSITFLGTGQGVWLGTSSDGARWRLDRTVTVMGADPAGVPTPDGGWVMTVTGPPRPGTASAKARGRGR